MATLARMHVELIARGDRYQRDIKKARTTTEKLRHELTKTRSVIGLLAGAAGLGLVASRLFEMGAAAEETASKFGRVFGESTKGVQRFIDSWGTLAGLTDQQAQEIISTTGAIVKGMGLTGQAAADFSVEISKVAGDLGSFYNIPVAETSMAVQAALTGEREQMKRLGIVIREADVQQRAMVDSGKSNAAALTQQEKAIATLAIITEKAASQGALGDLVATQDSAAARARKMKAEVGNLAEELAVVLLPAMSWVLEKLIAFIGGMKIWVAEIRLGWATLKMYKEQWFGTAESMLQAEVAMEQALLNLIWVNHEIAQGSAGLGIFNNAASNVAPNVEAAAESLRVFNATLQELNDRIIPVTEPAIKLTSTALHDVDIAAMEAKKQLALAGTEMTKKDLIAGKYTATVNAAAAAQNSFNSALSDTGSVISGIGSILGAFGQTIPFLGSITGALGGVGSILGIGGGGKKGKKFAGMFADGGMIGAGEWGIVGERGPEIVQGPANVAPMEQAARPVTINLPPASSRMERMFHEWLYESLKSLEHSGVRLGTA